MKGVLVCPRCAAPRVEAPDCPRCGILYARAAPPPASEPAPAWQFAPAADGWSPAVDQARFEWRVRLWALPSALALAFLFTSTGPGGFLVRLLSGMWLHELGHAWAAWLCGRFAIPLPWVTFIGESRSAGVLLVMVALWGGLAVAAWKRERMNAAAVCGTLALAHLAGPFLIPAGAMEPFITFAGDGGALVFATALMATLYAEEGSRLHDGALRWGLLALGAMGFADVFRTWWRARTDWSAIPFGRIEGVGLSDPSKLVDAYGWSERGMIHAYLLLGGVCLGVLAVLYVAGLRRARAELREALGEA